MASTVATTPSSMAQDGRALEGEGVGGVSNRQVGLCGQCEATQEAEIPGSASMLRVRT